VSDRPIGRFRSRATESSTEQHRRSSSAKARKCWNERPIAEAARRATRKVRYVQASLTTECPAKESRKVRTATYVPPPVSARKCSLVCRG